MPDFLHIDGSLGEGGGQILRTSLAMSLCLGIPFHITGVRAGRKRPGLQPQHLAAVRAAAEISSAELTGATRGSVELTFAPRAVRDGHYRFATGTAGSATLVLQTVLPALLTAGRPSHLELSGGTHNPLAPSFDFIQLAFLPLVNRLGPHVTAHLTRPGFYPAGGGLMQVDIEPARQLKPLCLPERGPVMEKTASALVSRLPLHIAQRELQVLGRDLGLAAADMQTRELTSAAGPGNVVSVVIRSRHITEVFAGFGMPGIRAETVASRLAGRVRRYLDAGVPVGEHLADQLLLPLALAGKGAFTTVMPTPHTETNIAVIQRFLDVGISSRAVGDSAWRIEVK